MDTTVATIAAMFTIISIVLGFIKIIRDAARDKERTTNDIKNLAVEIRNEVRNRQKEQDEMCELIDKISQKFEIVATRLADITIIDGNQKATDRRMISFEQAQDKINDKIDNLNEIVNKIWVSLERKANREDRER